MNPRSHETKVSNSLFKVRNKSKKRGAGAEYALDHFYVLRSESHERILSHLQALRYISAISFEQQGVCLGIAWMGIQAILADDIQPFDERMKTLDRINSKDLARKIAEAKEAEKQRIQDKVEKQLPQEQQDLLSVEAFFNGVVLSHSLRHYAEWFKEIKPHCDGILEKKSRSSDDKNFSTSGFLPLQDVKLTLPFTLPDKLMIKKQIKIDGGKTSYLQKIPGVAEVGISIIGIYNVKELASYFETLRGILIKQKPSLQKPVAFMLSSSNHAISIKWDFKLKTWIYIDVDQLPLKRENSDKAMARHIIAAFTKNMTTAFSMKMYVHKSELKQATKCMRELKLQLEKATIIEVKRKDSFGTSLIHIAAREGDYDTIKKLLQLKVDVNLPARRGAPSLAFAIQSGHVDLVKALLDHNAATYLTDNNSYNALHFAARSGHIEIIKLLLAKGEKINSINEAGHSALHAAAVGGKVEAVEWLLENKAEINSTTSSGESALHFAAKEGQMRVVNLLLDKKADINLQLGDVTVLDCAIRGGHIDLVKVLIERKANIHLRDKNDIAALHLAAGEGYIDIVEWLLTKNAEIDSTTLHRQSALHYAANAGHIDLVEVLLNQKANIQLADNDGKTAFHFAATVGHTEIIKLLLTKNAKIDSTTLCGQSALHYAVSNNHVSLVEVLLNQKASIPLTDKDGRTALHLAVERGQIEMTKRMLDQGGAELKSITSSALHVAIREKQIEFIKLLLEKKADVNFQVNDRTAFYLAVEYAAGCDYDKNKAEIVKLLLGKEANVNLPTTYGITPLDFALFKNDVDLVKVLLESKADIHLKNKNGNTALHSIIQLSCIKIVEFLLSQQTEINSRTNLSALHIAITEGQVEIVKLLLEKKVDVNLPIENDLAPLSVAAAHRWAPVGLVKELINHNANIDLKDKKDLTALHYAASEGRSDIVEALLDANADINSTCKPCLSPLHIATMGNWVEVAQLLIDRGANINCSSEYGLSVLDLAKTFNRQKIIKLLDKKQEAMRCPPAPTNPEECKTKLSSKNKEGVSTFHLSAETSHSTKPDESLFDKEVAVNSKTKDGQISALGSAREHKPVDHAKLLPTQTSPAKFFKSKNNKAKKPSSNKNNEAKNYFNISRK